ncbi:MAG TPA: UV DNA damage repair endonuclease UvsE [Blastocatellia bacterium]|nr:UV DNA damage repair endonuclease UvsE [Blastocatellia bacterium]
MANLGLVCITTSDRVRFRTITRKRLLPLSEEEKRRALEELYSANLVRLNAAIDFCEEQGIKLYRLSSSLFPFADESVGEEVLSGFSETMRQIGERAIDLGIRLVMHPDQFVVLSSDSEVVIENSVKILRMHARTLDMLAQPCTAWAAMQLHGGKGDRADRLVSVIRDLPDNIHKRLALENDERAYGAREILEVCRAADVPMVFDAHHHVIHERLESYDDPSIGKMLTLARETWPEPAWQMVHISNGREFFNDPRHSDLITAMPRAYRDAPWIEVEAKLKEVAIEKIRAEWLSGLLVK